MRKPPGLKHAASLGVLAILPLVGIVSAQSNFTCIPLQGSTTCANFSAASVSTSLTTDFPFLQFVSTVQEFDAQFMTFIEQDYTKKKYQETLECEGINLANTSDLYARFTRTVLCGQMIQESIQLCGLTQAESPPVCASTCAEFATSEETIVMTPEFCGGTSVNLTDLRVGLIRADFTVCSLPANSLSSSCIDGLVNEPDNCGFGTNLPQLCTYCGRTSPNATSFCCLSSNLTACSNINIPPTRPLPPIFTTTAVSTITATSTSPSKHLSPGAVVGIAISAAVVGLVAAGALVFLYLRRQQTKEDAQRPLRPKTSKVPMSCGPFPERNGYEAIEDGTHVRRMEAMHSGEVVTTSPEITPPRTDRTRRSDHSSSDNNALSSPEGGSPLMIGTLPPPPPPGGGAFSGSIPPSPTIRPGLVETAAVAGAAAAVGAAAATRSSGSNGGRRGSRTSTTMSSMSPGTEASEAASVSVVADHYSTNSINRRSDVVALWSYTPRLADEMALERGDVVRIENLYDDGWALGRKVKQKIWDMAEERSTERDSGIGTSQRESTSTTHRISTDSPPKPPSTRSSDKGKEKDTSETGSIKAFPMVCVCHRDAWAEVVSREEEESTSPTPELGGRRISPTRMDLNVAESSTTPRKETRFEPEDTLSSSDNSPEGRGRTMPIGSPPSRSSSQGSRYQEQNI